MILTHALSCTRDGAGMTSHTTSMRIGGHVEREKRAKETIASEEHDRYSLQHGKVGRGRIDNCLT